MLETAPAKVTTAGDLVYGTGANAIARLGIGSAGRLLRVNAAGTAPEWGAPNYDQFVRKTASETVNNSSTLQDDDALVVPILANEVWVVEFVVVFNSNTTADIKFAVTVPSGATGRVSIIRETGAAIAMATPAFGNAAAADGNAVHVFAELKAYVINGANAGNVTLQWAQNVADPSDTIVYRGSHAKALKAA